MVLGKCVKEAIIFSVIALKYDASNALNAVFEESGADDQIDHLSLLRIGLPSIDITDCKESWTGGSGGRVLKIFPSRIFTYLSPTTVDRN